MAKNIPLTLACGDYEIVRPLIDGRVNPDGIDLTVVTDMDSTTRHWRFLREGHFDVAETSYSSYVVARDQGMPVAAIPVFLHRRFRHGFVFVNKAKGITKPADLIGRRVGVKGFMVTAVHWMRGILEHEYGVPHKSIDWVAELDDDVTIEWPADLRIRYLKGESVEDLLLEGEIDALIHSDLIKPDPRVGRLWPDYKAEEIRFYQKTGIFPIMHVMGIRQEIVDRHPWIPLNLHHAFEKAKALGMRRMTDPRVPPVAWYVEAWEEQQAILGPDPWKYGLDEQNRKNVETLAGYSHEQGLTQRRWTADELFLSTFQGRMRGEKFRI